MAKRVLLIGLDGASPALVAKWKDDLPNLSRLMTEGSWGVLHSTMPPYTLPAWQSMVTGVNPGKLGIFGFLRRVPGTFDFLFNSMADSPAPALWDILGQEGLASGIVGLPGTFPPLPLDGFMVSGFPAPANDGRLVFTSPAALSRELDGRFGGYDIRVHKSYQPGDEQAFIAAIRSMAQLHAKAAVWLAETRSWDFLAVIFLSIDRASHYFWRFMDPNHPAHDPEEAVCWGDAVHDFYRLEDENVGRLLRLVTEDDLVLIASDHGFCSREKTFFINDWLHQKGYLHLTGRVPRRKWLGRWVSPLVRLYQRYTSVRSLLSPFRRTAARDRLMAAHLAHRVDRVGLENAPIDWGRTMAYALDQHRLYLNLQGREPEGIVSPEAYDSVLSQIEADLSQLTDRAGRPLSTDFYRGRHLYSGPFVQEAPDLLVFLDGYHCDVNYRLGGERFMETSLRLSGTHHPEGLLMLWGKDVRAGHHLEANIVDIAPTIVHALGAPISSECDGQPIWEAFEKRSGYTQRPLRSKSFTAQPKEGHVWTEEEEAQVMERLRDLGYL